MTRRKASGNTVKALVYGMEGWPETNFFKERFVDYAKSVILDTAIGVDPEPTRRLTIMYDPGTHIGRMVQTFVDELHREPGSVWPRFLLTEAIFAPAGHTGPEGRAWVRAEMLRAEPDHAVLFGAKRPDGSRELVAQLTEQHMSYELWWPATGGPRRVFRGVPILIDRAPKK